LADSSSCVFAFKPGDYVVVVSCSFGELFCDNYWIGIVLYASPGARIFSESTLYQLSNIDNGTICSVNADRIKGKLIPPSRG
tara:strand:+ start:527 stop:772 length:246 start_codon:yes stop_codon:yes gene_type:complete